MSFSHKPSILVTSRVDMKSGESIAACLGGRSHLRPVSEHPVEKVCSGTSEGF